MAIVIVTTRIQNQVKFLIGKESRFLRDIHEDVGKLEKFSLPGDYMSYYTLQCKRLSRKYGMRIQFDTPDIYPTHTRARFRYLEQDWRYGIVKGSFNSHTDSNSLDTALREFNEEVMPFEDRELIEDLNTKIHYRDLYALHLKDPTDLCKTIAKRTNMYYGELFEMEILTWDELQLIWKNLNVVSKRSLEFIVSLEQLS
jgi:hypothetical protein